MGAAAGGRASGSGAAAASSLDGVRFGARIRDTISFCHLTTCLRLGPCSFERNACHRAAQAGQHLQELGDGKVKAVNFALNWLCDHSSDPTIHLPLLADPPDPPSAATPPPSPAVAAEPVAEAGHNGAGEAWAVVVGGGEGGSANMFSLHHTYDFLVDRLGRANVILIANIEEVRQVRIERESYSCTPQQHSPSALRS